jgi:hypothetical protein
MTSETEQFFYKNTILISVIASSSDASQEQFSLHHWHHHLPGTSFSIPTTLILDNLRHISTFCELGTFLIPSSQSSAQDRHTFLSSLTARQDVDIGKSIIEHLIAQLQASMPAEPSSSPKELASLKLYSIEVLTRAEDALANSDADEIVWKWTKPTSPYRTSGFWCSTIEEAVVDGVWNAGRGFLMLVEAVGKGKKNGMFKGEKKMVIIPRIERDV